VLRSIIPVGVAPLIDTHHLVGAARNTIPLRRADRWIDPPYRADTSIHCPPRVDKPKYHSARRCARTSEQIIRSALRRHNPVVTRFEILGS
jgi:hypothetical protein